MAKWYVSSGTMKRIQIADEPKDAICLALQREFEEQDEMQLGIFIRAGERGFEETQDDDWFIATDVALEQADLIEFFSLPDSPGEVLDG